MTGLAELLKGTNGAKQDSGKADTSNGCIPHFRKPDIMLVGVNALAYASANKRGHSHLVTILFGQIFLLRLL